MSWIEGTFKTAHRTVHPWDNMAENNKRPRLELEFQALRATVEAMDARLQKLLQMPVIYSAFKKDCSSLLFPKLHSAAQLALKTGPALNFLNSWKDHAASVLGLDPQQQTALMTSLKILMGNLKKTFPKTTGTHGHLSRAEEEQVQSLRLPEWTPPGTRPAQPAAAQPAQPDASPAQPAVPAQPAQPNATLVHSQPPPPCTPAKHARALVQDDDGDDVAPLAQ
ncbi:hypothetical protein PAPYR_12105 [Paratrimastix pyriformis]|uniref:Uncharacterized protein n=1 Tax=Paratrimastix pyriformis TaxID=342808 RepID=A0ABQ8U7W3_9EUKA|nr:hypothetical protein PAPYR_12105 [Paratrimastix pyriformis]